MFWFTFVSLLILQRELIHKNHLADVAAKINIMQILTAADRKLSFLPVQTSIAQIFYLILL